MPVACSELFRQRVCHFPSCGAVFYLCRHCDRGQRYCSARCREKALRLQRREANRRHQQSPEGRADHRDRQREYRVRLKARSHPARASVTDPSSLRLSPCANVIAPSAELAEIGFMPDPQPAAAAEVGDGGVLCQICARRGRWIDPFAG